MSLHPVFPTERWVVIQLCVLGGCWWLHVGANRLSRRGAGIRLPGILSQLVPICSSSGMTKRPQQSLGPLPLVPPCVGNCCLLTHLWAEAGCTGKFAQWPLRRGRQLTHSLPAFIHEQLLHFPLSLTGGISPQVALCSSNRQLKQAAQTGRYLNSTFPCEGSGTSPQRRLMIVSASAFVEYACNSFI